jgi:hypothetical protein
MNFYSYVPHSLSIFGETDVTDLHVMLLRICEFHKHQYSKHLSLLMAINEITFSHAL